MTAIEIEHTIVRKVEDCNKNPIRVGMVVENQEDGFRGVIQEIRTNETDFGKAMFVGDMVIGMDTGSYRCSNMYSNWRIIPMKERTIKEKYISWIHTPNYQDLDLDDMEASERMAMDAVLSLLSNGYDTINWESTIPHSFVDALRLLVNELTDGPQKDNQLNLDLEK